MQNTDLIIKNVTFSNNENNLFLITNCNLTFENSSLLHHICSSIDFGCFIKGVQNSRIYLLSSLISNVISNFQGGIIYLDESLIFIENSSFSDLRVFTCEGSCILSTISLITILNSKFIDYDGNCIYQTQGSLSIEKIIFDNFQNKNSSSKIFGEYGTVFCDSCENLNINNSYFYENHNVQIGGAITLISTIYQYNVYIINECQFINNIVSQKGGAISIFDSNSTVTRNYFSLNTATYGGGIYFESQNINIILYIENNSFSDNTADLEGGAIKWIKIKPQIQVNNIFLHNNALYGNDIAAFPIRMIVNLIDENETISLENFTINQIPTILNITTGNAFIYNISVKIIDYYGQVVSSLTSNMFLYF